MYITGIERFAQLASRVWGVNIYFDNLEKAATEGINALKAYKETGLPTRLNQLGIGATGLKKWHQNAEND